MNDKKVFTALFIAMILVISSIPMYVYLNNPEASNPIKLNTFSSYEELKTFLENTSNSGNYYYPRGGAFTLGLESFSADAKSSQPAFPVEPTGTGYSETNVQVEGVDEADIVKTDGEYIYVVSKGNLTIVKGFPAEEARVVSKIVLEGAITGIFINGDKLTLFETEYGVYPLYEEDLPVPLVDTEVVNDSTPDDKEPVNPTDPSNQTTPSEEPDRPVEGVIEPVEPFIPIIYEPPTTTVRVYDISDKQTPVLTREFSVDGTYFSSRMIGDYVYVISNQYTYFVETDVFLPRVHSGNQTQKIGAREIYYYNNSDTSYSFTTIAAINVQNDQQEPTYETILMGSTSTIYVSQNNIYLTFREYSWEEPETTKTSIQRIKIDKNTIMFEAQGEVQGTVLNQFSMDEHKEHFRIATTIGHVSRTFDEATSKNNVYVLDMNLNVVGNIEDLAPGEKIYSTRFMGDRCYVVTFKKVDPLFVIDLETPTNPKVLGQLKVTGYSDYLHPYDENHLIGIGKETVEAEEGDFAWYQGVKISLFDVSDVSNPKELTKFEIGDRGTDSPVLDDHKALLFDKARNLLVLPVLVAEINPDKYTEEIPDNARGDYVWQGAYVFDMSLDGLHLRGKITHIDNSTDLLKNGYYFRSTNTVKRTLYINNVLYTISDMKIKMNSLDTLVEINSVEIA